ncbi:MAG: hypothetical protein IJW48_02715 [Clostridia bacterium]|nr:hypothetical protein [Clostridia bacterium]
MLCGKINAKTVTERISEGRRTEKRVWCEALVGCGMSMAPEFAVRDCGLGQHARTALSVRGFVMSL